MAKQEKRIHFEKVGEPINRYDQVFIDHKKLHVSPDEWNPFNVCWYMKGEHPDQAKHMNKQNMLHASTTNSKPLQLRLVPHNYNNVPQEMKFPGESCMKVVAPEKCSVKMSAGPSFKGLGQITHKLDKSVKNLTGTYRCDVCFGTKGWKQVPSQ